MNKRGILFISLALLITAGLWILSKDGWRIDLLRPYRLVGQISGLLGATLLCIQFFLAARLRFVEKIFKGLDKVYKTHAYVGAFAFVLLLNHPLFLALNLLPSSSGAASLFFISDNSAYNYGLFSLYSMALLIILTLFIKLPYHIWKYTHTFMVVPLVFFLLHISAIEGTDISDYLALKIWMFTLGFTAIAAYIYKRFLYPLLGPQYSYKIDFLNFSSDILELKLSPVGKKMEFYPGQFVFLSILNEKKIGKEEHPFSISSGPDEHGLRLSIKMVGDYTKKLPGLKVRTLAKISGPFGNFGERSLSSPKDDVWIAGGIGITPFLSLLNYYCKNKAKKNIWLFYSHKTNNDSIYHKEINSLVQKNSYVRFSDRVTQKQGRLKALDITGQVKNIENKQIFLCGPRQMMEDLIDQFLSLGIKPKNIIFEEFSLIL